MFSITTICLTNAVKTTVTVGLLKLASQQDFKDVGVSQGRDMRGDVGSCCQGKKYPGKNRLKIIYTLHFRVPISQYAKSYGTLVENVKHF